MNEAEKYVRIKYPMVAYYLYEFFDVEMGLSPDLERKYYVENATRNPHFEEYKEQLRNVLSDSSVDWVAMTTESDTEVYVVDDALPEFENQKNARAFVKSALWDPLPL